jgi:hypothetical protein
MSKAAPVQQTLFGPWLAWDQLPDSIREQTLELLTSLCLEIADAPRIREPETQELPTIEGTRAQFNICSDNGVTIR